MLERVNSPEELGIDSKEIEAHLKYYDSINMRIDSYMVIRHGKVACETYNRPYRADIPHEMFSLSKSITSTAIGIAFDEGILSLDEPIYPKYFPERLAKLKGKQLERAKKLNLHHVITMCAGKTTNIIESKEKHDWLDSFLDCPIEDEPGTKWNYISENAYLLSWILQKETGMTMTEYLNPRLYEPLGMKTPHWDKDSRGVDAGGWGVSLTTEDLAKIAILYLNKGVYDGKRIFSEKWYELATHPHVPAEQIYPIFMPRSEYGYQIWIDHEHNDSTKRFTGLYGQFVVMFHDYDAALIITARDNRDGELIHSIYEHYPKAFAEPKEVSDKADTEKFKNYLSSRYADPGFKSPTERNSAKEKEINGRMIRLLPKINLSTQGMLNYFLWSKKIGFMNDIKFEFSTDSVAFSFKEKNSERAVIEVGLNGEYIENKIVLAGCELIVFAQGTWNKDGSLEIYFYNAGKPQTRRFRFTFRGNRVKIQSKTDPGYLDLAVFNIQFNMGKRVGGVFKNLIRAAVPVFNHVYGDPGSVGRFAE